MKLTTWILVLIAGSTFILAGCGEKKTVRTPEGKELSLRQPGSQTLVQGGTNKVLITIERKGFDGEVKIDFDDLPSGVSVAEQERIAPTDTARSFTLVAKDNAPLIEKKVVTVEAKGGGAVVKQTFEVTVKAKS